MAKIILLGRHLHQTLWPLAQSLLSQQHQVTVVTEVSHPESDFVETDMAEMLASQIDVIKVFRRWNAWEALRFMPHLISINPQIFHLVLEKDNVTSAELLLSAMAHQLPQCIVTTSFLNPEGGIHRDSWLKYLVEHSDIVTCPSPESLGQLRGLNVNKRKQNRGILPPLLDHSVNASPSCFKGIEQLTEHLIKLNAVALPFVMTKTEVHSGFMPLLNNLFRKIASRRHLVLLGNWDEWPIRSRKKISQELRKAGVPWTLSGSNQSSDNQMILKSCRSLWLAGLPLTPSDYTHFLWLAWQASATPIIDSSQATMHADLWKNGVNCHILNKDLMSTEVERILALESLATPEHLSTQSSRDIADHSINDLSRLYNKALSEKAVS